MSRVYLIGDTHFGHKNICKFRTMFESPEGHDNVLFERIMSTLTKRDTLWLMGDICFSEERLYMLEAISREIGNVHWILGNHDTQNTERQRILAKSVDLGIKLHSLVSYKGTWLSHHPIHPKELRGKHNLHGHVHTATIREHGYFNCSAENLGFYPREFKDIKAACESDRWDLWDWFGVTKVDTNSISSVN